MVDVIDYRDCLICVFLSCLIFIIMISRLISVLAWWYVVNQVCLSFVAVCLICVDLECHVVNHYGCSFLFFLFHGA